MLRVEKSVFKNNTAKDGGVLHFWIMRLKRPELILKIVHFCIIPLQNMVELFM